jgi:hypothetical protein
MSGYPVRAVVCMERRMGSTVAIAEDAKAHP